MAKRKRLRPQRFSHTTTGALMVQHDALPEKRWQASTVIHPLLSATKAKRGVARAQQKHRNDHLIGLPSAAKPTLADRFYGLPQELRNHIFALLLSRPVKWDVEHDDGCSLRTSNIDPTPTISSLDLTCADCCAGTYYRVWRHCLLTCEIWVNPWRSEYAPERLNPYLCSDCYDRRWRPRPFPRNKSLPCLCARRLNLQIMLVCKRWYREATQIFYTENTFAFENSTTFAAFVQNLNPRSKNLISKVSILTLKERARTTPRANIAPNANLDELRSGWESSAQLRHVWSHLRQLPSLSHLELDALFLTRATTVDSMRRLGLRNLRSVRFCARLPDANVGESGHPAVWPAFAGRTMLLGGLAEDVARAIKGQRRLALRTRAAVQRAVEKHNALEEKQQ